MALASKFESHLKKSGILKPGSRVFVACSGGPDSVALFLLLRSLPRTWKLKLGLLHVHHALRGKAADGDAAFVRRLARRHKVPYKGVRIPAKVFRQRGRLSVEEIAREERYRLLAVMTANMKRVQIATAHTLDDQAETVLMRVLQGTGIRGLQGIRETATISGTDYVRPLLVFRKPEILEYLEGRSAGYRRDGSNRETRFLRNWIRLDLMPVLSRRLNPKIAEALARIPATVAQDARLLQDLEDAAWKRTVRNRGRKGQLNLGRDVFMRFPDTLKYRLLNRGLRRLNARSGVSFDAWERLKGILSRKQTRCSLPGKIELILTSDNLTIYDKRADKPAKTGKKFAIL